MDGQTFRTNTEYHTLSPKWNNQNAKFAIEDIRFEKGWKNLIFILKWANLISLTNVIKLLTNVIKWKENFNKSFVQKVFAGKR